MGLAQDAADRRDLAADEAAQERGPVPDAPGVAVTSAPWTRGVNPEGELVTSVPREALPGWVVQACMPVFLIRPSRE
jgi:hypothetical protein